LITEALGDEDKENNIILLNDGMKAIDYFQEYSIESQIENRIKLIAIYLKLSKINRMDLLKFFKENSKYSKISTIIFSNF